MFHKKKIVHQKIWLEKQTQNKKRRGSKCLQMECIGQHYREHTLIINSKLLRCRRSVEANHKLSVCVCECVCVCVCVCLYDYSGNKHSECLEGNTLKSICPGCTMMNHMTSYRTADVAGYPHTCTHTHTHTHAYCLWDMLYCHRWKHCSCVCRGTH